MQIAASYGAINIPGVSDARGQQSYSIICDIDICTLFAHRCTSEDQFVIAFDTISLQLDIISSGDWIWISYNDRIGCSRIRCGGRATVSCLKVGYSWLIAHTAEEGRARSDVDGGSRFDNSLPPACGFFGEFSEGELMCQFRVQLYIHDPISNANRLTRIIAGGRGASSEKPCGPLW